MTLINDIIDQAILFILHGFGAAAVFLLGQILAKIVSTFVRNFMEKKQFSVGSINSVGKTVYYFLMTITIIFTFRSFFLEEIASVFAIAAFVAVAVFYGYGIENLILLKDNAMKTFANYSFIQENMMNMSAQERIKRLDLFNVGDVVKVADDAMGVIQDIEDFYTVLSTPDKKTIIIPNTMIVNNKIINYTAEGIRGISFTFGIGYDANLQKAKQIIQEIVKAESYVLPEPEPVIGVSELADSSVNFLVRVFVNPKDYLVTLLNITEQIKLQFDEAGINIPYPQQDIHLYNVNG